MSFASVSVSFEAPRVDVVIDMGHPFLNCTIDGFLKIGAGVAGRNEAQETYHDAQQVNSRVMVSTSGEQKAMSRSANSKSHNVDLVINMGHPFLNRAIYGFLKIGAVGVSRVLVHETCHILGAEHVSKKSTEHVLKKMCIEGAYWGSIAGAYKGIECEMEHLRRTRDWKNAMFGGVIVGAVASAANGSRKERIIVDAVTGGALAVAAELLNGIS